MKKLFKICENLTINPNFIYAIGKENNQSKIDDWNKTYKAYLEELIKNPVELDIDGTLYTLSETVFGFNILISTVANTVIKTKDGIPILNN